MFPIFSYGLCNQILKIGFWMVGIGIVAVASAAEWRGLAAMHLLGYDYAFFYYAFQIVHHHHSVSQLYNLHAVQIYMSHRHFPDIPYNGYVYPPQFAVLLSPLGWLPPHVSMFIWRMISILSYGFGVVWSAKVIYPRISRGTIAVLLLVSLILTPFQIDAGAGNVNSILFGLVALTFYLLYYKKQAWWSGIPLGLAIVFKVTPLAVLVYLLLRGKWRTGASAGVTMVVSTAITVSAIGYRPLALYIEKFLSFGQTSMKNGPAPYNQSLLGVLGMLKLHHAVSWSNQFQHVVFLGFALIAGLIILAIVRKRQMSSALDFAIASMTPLVFSPLVEQMHLTFAIPAIFVLTILSIRLFIRRRGRPTAKPYMFAFVSLASVLLLSLPATFALNSAIHLWPDMYFAHTQMFCVWILLFITVAWLRLFKPNTVENLLKEVAVRKPGRSDVGYTSESYQNHPVQPLRKSL